MSAWKPIPQNGSLRLDEKGTVYTEMVSAFEKPWYPLERTMSIMTYGENHPLAKVTGGDPAGLRQMQPSDMRAFLARYYRLDNMGMITTIPGEITPEQFMARTDSILNGLYRNRRREDHRPVGRKCLRRNRRLLRGRARIVTYPGAGASDPGYISMGWPADLTFDNSERLLLQVFLYCLGGKRNLEPV